MRLRYQKRALQQIDKALGTIAARATPLPWGERQGRGDHASVERQTPFRANPGENGVEFVAHLFVREANDPDSEPLQHIASRLVVVCEPLVLLAVQFDRTLGRVAVEIEDITINGNLPPKLCAFEARAVSDACARRARIRVALKPCLAPSPLPSPNGRGGHSAALRPFAFRASTGFRYCPV